MKNRILALCMTVLMLSLVFVSADTVDTRADALFDLGILRGDGVSFQLDKTLTRAEALAFITRVKGDELSLPSLYSTQNETKFKDNIKDQWYTRYVNYGVANGLINGYNDGSFKPKAELTDKAFLKLLLVATGYTYDQDFTWDTIYAFALEKGLIQVIPEKEAAILRGDVVSLIYKALSLQTKN